MFVGLKSRNAGGTQNYIYCRFPVHKPLPSLVSEEIDYIQATGEELKAIKEAFMLSNGTVTIPFTNCSVMRWYGDIAKTIFYNLG
jgi:hypothetical protein